jgi:hypothetical protein
VNGPLHPDVADWLDAADAILADPDRTSPRWLRAAGVLYRSALEEWLAAFWRERARGVATANFRTQLACLTVYTDEDRARTVANVWGQLSDMAHHRSDLGPERLALVRAGEAVRALVEGRVGLGTSLKVYG